MHRSARGRFRSYDHHGEGFHWHPPAGLAFQHAALDAESREAPGVRSMSARFGLPDEAFLKRWTSTEAVAKVLDWPILDFVKRVGLVAEAPFEWSRSDFDVWVRSIEHPNHWVTVALILPGRQDDISVGHAMGNPDHHVRLGVAVSGSTGLLHRRREMARYARS